MFDAPIITRRTYGEYSTVRLPDGMVETAWFPDDTRESYTVIGRSWGPLSRETSRMHIAEWEK